MSKELLRMEKITKIYPNGFIANQDITFSVKEKEIHSLIGENGAGKTTLMKILFGMEEAQEGTIYLNGDPVKINSPLHAIKLGIGMVHQHFMLVPSLTVAENVTLGFEPMKHGLFDMEKAIRMTQEIADKYEFKMDVTKKVSELSVGQMQKVEILKALIKGAKILVLDEPTAVLTPQETEELFEQLLKLRDGGHSIIFISHKLDEIMRICSNVTVLRHGKCMGTYPTEELTESSLAKLMVGREVGFSIEKEEAKRGKAIVKVQNVVKINEVGKNVLDHVSFNVYSGEVIGVAGVEGNGQLELCNVLSGMTGYDNGEIILNDSSIKGKTVKEIRSQGLAYISEDRMVYGVAGDMSIKDNIMSDRYDSKEYKRGIFTDRRKINQLVDDYIKEFEIACDNREQPVRMLSGGNIQKVVVAREFTTGANFIIASQPTRGIDVGTAEMIRKNIVKKSREEQVSTLLISADLNELLECSDRLMVMRKGKIAAIFPDASVVNEEILGEYMLGVKEMSPAEMEEYL